MEAIDFNVDNGYLEGIVRGFKGGIITNNVYTNLTQCETLEGIIQISLLKKKKKFRVLDKKKLIINKSVIFVYVYIYI